LHGKSSVFYVAFDIEFELEFCIIIFYTICFQNGWMNGLRHDGNRVMHASVGMDKYGQNCVSFFSFFGWKLFLRSHLRVKEAPFWKI
jgi:hypothetical protein